MDYYGCPSEQMERLGIDYDLWACLEFNPQPFNVLDIERVLAVNEGTHDDRDWYWVILLRDGRYVYLQGGCDYTGWDCQSSADTAFYPTAEEAACGTVGRYDDNSPEIQALLLAQIEQKKAETWREKKDAEFSLRDG